MRKGVYYTRNASANVFAALFIGTAIITSSFESSAATLGYKVPDEEIVVVTTEPGEEISEEEREIKRSVTKASYYLEDAITKAMKKAKEDLAEEIGKEGFDESLTMQSFTDAGNPYKEADYLDLISAYMIAKRNGSTEKTFYDLPLIDITVTREAVTEYVPKRLTTYREAEGKEGIYEISGSIYVYEPMELPVYEKTKDGYVKTDVTEIISLETKETTYGKVTLTGITADKILKSFDITDADAIKDYMEKRAKLSELINGEGIAQNVFVDTVYTDLITDENQEYLNALLVSGISSERKRLIKKAISLVGKVPYEWGGKASDGKYDTTWWTIDEDGNQKGLDCSGYVQWCFAGNILSKLDKINNLSSTGTILTSTVPITEEELQPGDLGLRHSGDSEETNHVGIYLGNGYWIHCSSEKGTVAIDQTDIFKVFRQMPSGDDEVLAPDTSVGAFKKINCEYTDEDVYLLAQLVINEADGEGFNGWVAVAEVVKNRVNSSDFPNTIYEVIYQKEPTEQFSDSERIVENIPSKEQISVVRQVLEGTLSILNNENCLYFKNAHGSTDDWGKLPYYKTINNHTFYTATKEDK